MCKIRPFIILLIAGYLISPICLKGAKGYAGPERFISAGSVIVNDTIPVIDTLRADDAIREVDTIRVNDSIQVSDTVAAGDSIHENGMIQETDTFPAGETVAAADTLAAPEAPEEEAEPEPSYWNKGGQTAFNFSQISLSNWSAGGQNSVSFSSYFNVFLNYKPPDDKLNWENTLDLGYGLIKQEQRGTVKSDDKIDFSSKFGVRASETWSYSSLLSFRTQFAPGLKSPGDTIKISNFLAPGYLNLSIGMDHRFDENINFYLSPLAGKVTLVYDEELSEAGLFGVERGENVKYEFGGFIRVQFRATLMENITVNSRLELFSNYLDKPKNFDVNSDTRINMQINRYISANLVIQMMYDENVRTRVDSTGDGILDTTLGPRLQVKQVFGLGLSYRF